MCRIFAYSGDVADADFLTAVTEFGKLARDGNVPQGIEPGHLDGWGMHATSNVREVYMRSVTEATPEDLTATLAPLGAGAGQVLVHLRKATIGANRIENVHPFLRGGVSLCHNGSIHAFPDATTVRNPHGDTDSERFFLRILERVSREERHSLDALGAAVEAEVESLKAAGDWTSLTCLLKSKQGFVLKYIWNEEHPQTHAGRLNDYYTFFKGTKGKTTILCSEKLLIDGFTWESLKNGTLVTVPV